MARSWRGTAARSQGPVKGRRPTPPGAAGGTRASAAAASAAAAARGDTSVAELLKELQACCPELALVVADFKDELLKTQGFDDEVSWWRHLEARFALRCLQLRMKDSLETLVVSFDRSSTEPLEKLELVSMLLAAVERSTEPRLAKSSLAPRGIQMERRYGLRPAQAEILRLLVLREAGTCRALQQFVAQTEDNAVFCSLCGCSKLDLLDFFQEKKQYIAEGVVRVQEGGYGDVSKEFSVSQEAVRALLGLELTTEQRLKLSSTVIEAVLGNQEKTEKEETAAQQNSAELAGSGRAEDDQQPPQDSESPEPEPAEEGEELDMPEDALESLQQPYRESLDYLNDQFSLLECEIRIAEHRRQTTKEDIGVEEPFILRTRKVNVFEYEAKRKLALARISHRLALTEEAGLEVPRLEALIKKKKLDDFEKNIVVMLIGQTLSPKIQATLSVGERRFCRDLPLQVRVILETFCRDFKEEVQKRVYFYKSSRLAGSGIIRIGAGTRSADLTNHAVHIDRRILDYVVGLDTEINEVVEGSNLYKPNCTLEQLVLPEDMKRSILELVCNFEQFCKYRKSSGLDDAIATGAGLVMLFCGPSGTGKTLMVNALAAHLDKRVLLVNFKTLYSRSEDSMSEEDGSNVLKLFREAEMGDAVLFFDECESLFSQRGSGGSSELTALLTAMERYEGMIFLATNRPFDLDEAMYRRITAVFTFSKPDHVQRLEIWKLYTQTGVPLAPVIDWEKIAMKFALTGGYIKNAIVSALLLAISKDASNPVVTEDDITAGCTMQVRGSLQMQSFSKRLVPRSGLESLVLGAELKQRLNEIVSFEKARPLLLETWGFGEGQDGPVGANSENSFKAFKPMATTALFWGAAGTGKSASAEALGFEFGRALKVLNFAEVASELKLGQKSSAGAGALETTFEEARAADAILVVEGIRVESLIDESDNIQDSTFQQLAFHAERFSGVVLLLVTSEEAFQDRFLPPELARLIKFTVIFDKPSPEQRAAIWRSAIPSRMPLASEVDFVDLSERFDISADGIKSAVFRAAAAAVLRQGESRTVTMIDLIRAAEAEDKLCKKSNNVLSSRPSIAEYLRKYQYSEHESFHAVYRLQEERGSKRSWKGCERLCLRLKAADLERLFIPIVTLDGIEGSYPEMFDKHPKDLGLCFAKAPNGRDILLVEAQARLGSDDLEGSMYSSSTGGLRHGHVACMEPVAQDGEQEMLVDMTTWIRSFAEYFKGDPGAEHTHVLEVKAYRSNFFVRYSTQQPSKLPVKSGSSSLTVYFTVAFVALPETPMVPRPSDPRVGYFTNSILVGGPKQATTSHHVISRWNLERHHELTYVIDRSVPEVYHDTIKKGVLAWNTALEACVGRAVLCCIAPGDEGYPEEYAPGDGRHVAVFMTNPAMKGLLGYGPSAVDYRSGEILMASVVLGFKPHVESASSYSEELLARPDAARGGCQRLLDADDPDVLKHLLETTVHEVGHTLGLRHNFIAAEDGHSSVMDYPDDLDTTDPHKPVFGGHFLGSPGRYDKYAISYGYTPLSSEVRGERHKALALLANGQQPDETELAMEPRNPLFATDEDVGGLDPRVQKRSAAVEKMGSDKIAWALGRRKLLLEHVQAGQIDCALYSEKVLGALEVAARSVLSAAAYVGGAIVDAKRSEATPCEAAVAIRFIAAVLQLLVGPIFRIDEVESRHLLIRKDGQYGLAASSALQLHAETCRSLLGRLLDASVLATVEAQRAACADEQRRPASTMQLLTALAFGSDESLETPRGLMWPLQAAANAALSEDLEAAAADPLACQARLVASELVNHLAREPEVHALVRAQAWALVQTLETALEPSLASLGALAKAHWGMVLEVLKERRRHPCSDSEDGQMQIVVS